MPGDKSLSHRAVLFASMAEGRSRLTGVLASADVRATIAACRQLGARITIEREESDRFGTVEVVGWGSHGPAQPSAPIDCGNSGTTVRLLMGLIAGWPIEVTLVGDESLSRRPMRRIAEPLELMGARVDLTPHGTLPATVHGTSQLEPAHYSSPVASAQVKTAVLLAGLRAEGHTRVTEPHLSRDHTERLLPAFGVQVTTDDAPGASVYGPAHLTSADVAVPGDPSSAAFLLVAGLLVPGSEVELPGVSLNPTRTGFVRVLERMGADVSVMQTGASGLEPVGILKAGYSPVMSATVVRAAEVPALIDEVPILALAASCATGTTRFEGVGELRVKESDRLAAIIEGLTSMGVPVRAGDDWLEVDGVPRLKGAVLSSHGDHRLAMTWVVAAQVAAGETEVRDVDAMGVSYPGFLADMRALMGRTT